MNNNNSPCILTNEEIYDFEETYHHVLKELLSISSGENKWFETVFHYNVPHGKKIRGKLVPTTVKCLKITPTKEEMKLAYVVGWCIEILQASFLVADDIMDESETRRGKLCWHKMNSLGAIAFNDSLLLEHAVYQILKKFFKDTPCYIELLQLFLDVTNFTVLGQSMDTQTGLKRNFNELTMEQFMSIAKHKTGYYTAYLPVASGMIISGKEFSNLVSKAEPILLNIGQFFQIQDDYLDCYGDPTTTGKIGTDIQNFKCTWLLAMAKEHGTNEQLTILEENYGQDDNKKVNIVKRIFEEIGISRIYKEYEISWRESISSLLETNCEQDSTIFYILIDTILKRQN